MSEARRTARWGWVVHFPALLGMTTTAMLLLAPSRALGRGLRLLGFDPWVDWYLGARGDSSLLSDKLGHALLFFVLAALIHRSCRRLLWVSSALVVGAVFTYGYSLLLEGLQWWVPGRAVELTDAIANASGVLAYSGLVLMRRRVWREQA